MSERSHVLSASVQKCGPGGWGDLLLEPSTAAAAALCLQERFSVEEAAHTRLNMVKE